MKHLVLALGLTCSILASCAPQVLQTTSSGGLIKVAGVTSRTSKSIKIADAECAKFGKVSKITRNDLLTNTITFDCVEK